MVLLGCNQLETYWSYCNIDCDWSMFWLFHETSTGFDDSDDAHFSSHVSHVDCCSGNILCKYLSQELKRRIDSCPAKVGQTSSLCVKLLEAQRENAPTEGSLDAESSEQTKWLTSRFPHVHSPVRFSYFSPQPRRSSEAFLCFNDFVTQWRVAMVVVSSS